MMLKPYTVEEIADIIQTSIDNAGDDKVTEYRVLLKIYKY